MITYKFLLQFHMLLHHFINLDLFQEFVTLFVSFSLYFHELILCLINQLIFQNTRLSIKSSVPSINFVHHIQHLRMAVRIASDWLTNFLLSPACMLRSSRSSWGISMLTFGIRNCILWFFFLQIFFCRFFYIYWSLQQLIFFRYDLFSKIKFKDKKGEISAATITRK